MNETSHIKLRQFIPNMVTLLAVCAGLTSVRMTLEGRLEAALYCILLAVLLDAVDGKLARYLDAASPLGAELDTLADFFNFGIAPGIVIYNTLYLGTSYASIGWMAVLILAICCALRLARFNLSGKSAVVTQVKADFFTGVPAPALACLALMPIFMYLHGWQMAGLALVHAAYIAFVGLLAISTIPTFSIKYAKITGAQLPMIVIALVLLGVGLVRYPWPTLIIGNCLYLASLPVSYMLHRKHTKRPYTSHAHFAD